MMKKLALVSALFCALSTAALAGDTRDFSALVKDGAAVVPYMTKDTTTLHGKITYRVYSLHTNKLIRTINKQRVLLPKTIATMCPSDVTWHQSEETPYIFGSKANYVYWAMSISNECEVSGGSLNRDSRTFFYSASVLSNKSCKYQASIRSLTNGSTTPTTNNVNLVSASEVQDFNNDGVKDVMLMLESPDANGVGIVIIDPMTCLKIMTNTYNVGAL